MNFKKNNKEKLFCPYIYIYKAHIYNSQFIIFLINNNIKD